MITLVAPYRKKFAVLNLPNPKLSDTEQLVESVKLLRAMDGTVRTIVVSGDGHFDDLKAGDDISTTIRRKLLYEFRIETAKLYQLREFLINYLAYDMQLTNHKNEIWRVYIANAPVDLESAARAAPAVEWHNVTLNFEGVRIS